MFVALPVPMFFTVRVYRSLSPASRTFGSPVMSAEIFCTWKEGAGLVTVLSVGSLGAGVRGSSDGWLTTPFPFTKPWFEITVPLAVFWFTTTSNVMVATLAGLLDASAGIDPGVGPAGELISMPFTIGDTPATSATGAPFNVVLPAT